MNVITYKTELNLVFFLIQIISIFEGKKKKS